MADPHDKPTPLSSTRHNWLRVTAKTLFVLTFVPIAAILYELWAWDENAAHQAGSRTYYYMVTVLCLSTVSGVLFGIYKTIRNRPAAAEQVHSNSNKAEQ